MSVTYLVEINHEAAEPHRNGLSALHASEDPIHQTDLCLFSRHVGANQSHEHNQTDLKNRKQVIKM